MTSRLRVPARLLAGYGVLLALAALVFLPVVLADPASASVGAVPAEVRPAGVHPAADDTFDAMTSFTSDFVLDADGGVSVTETIDYRFGAGEHHGIFRNIVVRQDASEEQKQQAGSDDAYRYFALDVEDVTSPTGAPTDTQLTDNGATVQIRIGDKDVTVDGTQTYVLKYHLANVMNPFTDHAEFFYNVFKDDPVPKDVVKLTVNGPGGVTQVRCARGDDKPCDSATPGSPATFTVTKLLGNEDLTMANSLPRAGFGDLSPDLRTGNSIFDANQAKAVTALALGVGIGAPIIAAGVMGTLVATRGRDEWYAGVTPGLTPGSAQATAPGGPPPPPQPVERGRRPTIAVQFSPPPGVQPGLVGTVIDESADTVDVSATVMDLAVRGFLQIEEVDSGGMFSRTDWVLRQQPAPGGQSLRPYEATVLTGLFETGSEVRLSELKYKFAPTLKSAISQMYTEVVDRGWFRKSPRSQRALWQALGFVLIGAGAISLFVLGFLSIGIDRTGGWGLPVPSGFVLGLGLVLAGVIFLVLGRRMAAKTAEGSAVLAQSLGFKMYLETAEAGQIRFEEASSVFSRYLPYAIVFGVADRWARTFNQVAEAAAAAGQPLVMPTWYLYHGAMFPDFTGIADGAGSFATSAGGTFAATQTSGSGGGSGFGGGGFSGGGIGGSSSGSW